MRFLLKNDAGFNGNGGYCKRNALGMASASGHSEVVKVLLEAGVNTHAESGYHGNSFIIASVMKRMDVMQILLDHGADVNAHTNGKGTALVASAMHGDEDVVGMLLRLGANVNARSPLWKRFESCEVKGA